MSSRTPCYSYLYSRGGCTDRTCTRSHDVLFINKHTSPCQYDDACTMRVSKGSKSGVCGDHMEACKSSKSKLLYSKPCLFQFRGPEGCRSGSMCKFSHNRGFVKAELKRFHPDLPSDDCANFPECELFTDRVHCIACKRKHQDAIKEQEAREDAQRELELSQRPCKWAYGSRGCRLGDRCTFSHNRFACMKMYNLHMCPGTEDERCYEMCKPAYKRCAKHHELNRRNRKSEVGRSLSRSRSSFHSQSRSRSRSRSRERGNSSDVVQQDNEEKQPVNESVGSSSPLPSSEQWVPCEGPNCAGNAHQSMVRSGYCEENGCAALIAAHYPVGPGVKQGDAVEWYYCDGPNCMRSEDPSLVIGGQFCYRKGCSQLIEQYRPKTSTLMHFGRADPRDLMESTLSRR